MDLVAEVRRQFWVKTAIVPIVLGALGTVPAKLLESLEKSVCQFDIFLRNSPIFFSGFWHGSR